MHLELLEDPGGELTIEEVSSPAYETQFVPSQEAVPNFGFTDSVYWARLRLDNKTQQIDEWLIDVNFANMHYVDLYTPSLDGLGFDVRQTGVQRPIYTRDVLYPHIVFELSVPGQTQPTYYLRFQSGASMTLALTLWNKDAFFAASQWVLMLHWLFFGSILALLVYHLFLLFSLREASYLYFVILLASLMIEELSYSGYLEVYFLPSLYYLKPIYYPLSFSVLIISMLLFSDSFLELQTRQPKLHRILFVFVAVWGGLMLLTPFTRYHILANLMIPWAFLSLIAVVTAGVISWRQSYRPAWFFLTAWIGMVIGFIVVFLVRWGIVPSTVFTENLYLFGFIWMAVCWSLAMADRINLLKIAAENASRNLRHSENRLTQILESLPLGVILYGKDEKPKYINQRTAEILSDPSKGIQPDISLGRTIPGDPVFLAQGGRRQPGVPLRKLSDFQSLAR